MTQPIAVISDTHDNQAFLERILPVIKAAKPSHILHAGDLSAPFMLGLIMDLGIEYHAVFGNGEGDPWKMSVIAAKYDNCHIHGPYAELELRGRKIAIQHYPVLARALARTGDYNAVFHGHNHTPKQEMIGDTLFANPGHLLYKSKSGAEAGFSLYNPEDNSLEFIPISSCPSL